MVQKGSGNFEVVEAGVAVVTGRIYIPDDINKESLNLSPLQDHYNDQENFLPLSAEDIYKELKLRGYNYKDLFRGITYYNSEGILFYVYCIESENTIHRTRKLKIFSPLRKPRSYCMER